MRPYARYADDGTLSDLRFLDSYDVFYIGLEAAWGGQTAPDFGVPVGDAPLPGFQGESIRMRMGDGAARAATGAVETGLFALGTAGNLAEGTVGGLLILAPEATGLTKVGGGMLLLDALDRQQAMFLGTPTGFERACSTYMTEDQTRRANTLKNAGMMLIMVGTAIPGANEPIGQMAAKGYLRVTKGASWRSHYGSFTDGTARLRVNLGTRRLLYRAHNRAAWIEGGEYAATTPSRSPVQGITKNALHPRLTGNRARIQYSVVPRPRLYFYIEGQAASQGGAFAGGNTQVFILQRAGGTYKLQDFLPYTGAP